MSDSPKKPSEDEPLPPPLTACLLTSMAALYLTNGRFSGLPVMCGLLLASYLTHWRMSPRGILAWIVRAITFAVILTRVGTPQYAANWFFDAQYTRLAGYLLAAEGVVRAWKRRDTAHGNRGELFFLSALILALAANTDDRMTIEIIGPLYMIEAVLTMRLLGRSRTEGGRSPTGPVHLWRYRLLGAAVVCLTLSIGFAAARLASRYIFQLDNWAVDLLQPHPGHRAESIGFSDAPRLERLFNPTASTQRVLRIEGTSTPMHLRVQSFDTYDQNQWLPDLQRRHFLAAAYLSAPQGTIAAPLTLHIRRLAELEGLVAIPASAQAIWCNDALERDELGTIRDSTIPPEQDYAVMVPAPEPGARADELSTDEKERDACGDRSIGSRLEPPPTERGLKNAMQLPAALDGRVIDLAKKVAGPGTPASRVGRLCNNLRTTHAYSLDFTPEGDPLNDFILNNRAAHCQYFASAMVVMSRAVGIPARFVTGFYAHEPYDRQTLVVRQRDAHAWAECWIDGRWVTVDATPDAGTPPGLFPDPSRWAQWRERAMDWPAAAWHGVRKVATRRMLSLAGGAILLIALGSWSLKSLVRGRRRRADIADAQIAPPVELTALARRFDRWLAQRGVAPVATRTWREQLVALPRASGIDARRAAEQFVRAYDRARFGEDSAQALPQAQANLDRLEAQP